MSQSATQPLSRDNRRVKVRLPVSLSWQNGERGGETLYARASTVDVSCGGMKVQLRAPIPIRVLVLLRCEELSLNTSATVRYCRRDGLNYIAGLEFRTRLPIPPHLTLGLDPQ